MSFHCNKNISKISGKSFRFVEEIWRIKIFLKLPLRFAFFWKMSNLQTVVQTVIKRRQLRWIYSQIFLLRDWRLLPLRKCKRSLISCSPTHGSATKENGCIRFFILFALETAKWQKTVKVQFHFYNCRGSSTSVLLVTSVSVWTVACALNLNSQSKKSGWKVREWENFHRLWKLRKILF